MDEMFRLFSLWEDRHSPLSSYSKGMRQKVLMSGALLGNPEVLILDEPFSGLDVNAAIVLRTLIRALADEGKMILYSSHVLEVVEKVCSSVLILRKGKAVAHDRVERLRGLLSQPSLEGVFTQLTEQEDPARVDPAAMKTEAHASLRCNVGIVHFWWARGCIRRIAGCFTTHPRLVRRNARPDFELRRHFFRRFFDTD